MEIHTADWLDLEKPLQYDKRASLLNANPFVAANVQISEYRYPQADNFATGLQSVWYKNQSTSPSGGCSPILQHATLNADVWGAVGNAAKISPAPVLSKQAKLRRHARSVRNWRDLKNHESPRLVVSDFLIDRVSSFPGVLETITIPPSLPSHPSNQLPPHTLFPFISDTMAKAPQDLQIAIIGAGMGGLTTALALAKRGFKNIDVYETAHDLGFVGAGIQLAPNMARVLDGLGVWRGIEAEAVDISDTSVRGMQI